MDNTNQFVPSSYFGVWRRSLLENKQGKDTSSLVLWMQTRCNHADIRIPASRPDFSEFSRLEEYSADALRWLATQQGFYGVTHVQNDICQWQRLHDFQPSNGARDIGKIAFTSAGEMLETGVEHVYLEIWHKVEGSHLNLETHIINGLNRYGESVPSYLLCAGEQLTFVRPRKASIPDAKSMQAAIDLYQPNYETLLDWLDFEISFGQKIDDEHWQITHSTHPFREGKMMGLSYEYA